MILKHELTQDEGQVFDDKGVGSDKPTWYQRTCEAYVGIRTIDGTTEGHMYLTWLVTGCANNDMKEKRNKIGLEEKTIVCTAIASKHMVPLTISLRAWM